MSERTPYKKPVPRGNGSSDLDREADEIMASLNAMLSSDEPTTDTSDTGAEAASAAVTQVAGAQPVGSSAVPEVIRIDGETPTIGANKGPLFPEVDEQPAAQDGLNTPADATTIPPTPPAPPQELPVMSAGPEQPAPRKKHGFLKALLVLVLLLGIAYAAGAVLFSNRFYPNTTVNGEDVSFVTTEEVAAKNSDSIKDFKLTVTGDGLDLTLNADTIGASYDGEAYADAAIKNQNPWMWPAEIAGDHVIRVESKMAFDDDKLSKVTGDAIDKVNKDAKKPVDAKLVQDKKTHHYDVKQEEKGTTIDKDAVLTLVRNGVTSRQSSIEIGEKELLQPQVTADDTALTAAAEKVNNALDATQDIVHGNETVAKVEEHELLDWVKLGDDMSLQVDGDAITKWARGTLSEHLDTIGATRTYEQPDGGEVTVSGGTYGWSINGEELAQHITDNVSAGKKGKIELTFLAEAKQWNPGGNDWGDTFVDIDLGSQYVHYYVDGKSVWEAPCVSGGPNIDDKDRRTPEGVYTINSNMRSGDVELRGEIDPKTNQPRYISHVKYWMPFIGDSVALHDADWRSEFGYEIYKTNGSHGCVNLPPDKAAELYDMVGDGTVVVCHG